MIIILFRNQFNKFKLDNHERDAYSLIPFISFSSQIYTIEVQHFDEIYCVDDYFVLYKQLKFTNRQS